MVALGHELGCELEYRVDYCLCNLRGTIASGIGDDLPVEFQGLNGRAENVGLYSAYFWNNYAEFSLSRLSVPSCDSVAADG